MVKTRTRAMIALVVIATLSSVLMSTTTSVNAQMFQPVPGSQSPQQQFNQLRQNFGMLEQQLTQMPPQQQQVVISNVQQQIMHGLTQIPPQAIPQVIQILQQAMSPQLAQAILAPIVAQLYSGGSNFGGGLGRCGPLESLNIPCTCTRDTC
jgi:hypothetical protein